MYIAELETDVYIAPWDGSPGITLLKNSAKIFEKKSSAWRAIEKAQKYRPFINAQVIKENN